MSILVTRPLPQGEALVSRLRASLEALPQGYFQELEKSLWNKLNA